MNATPDSKAAPARVPTRANRFFAIAGASAWLVVLVVASFFDARITTSLLLALGLPYLVVLWRVDRAAVKGHPQTRAADMFEAMGAYFLYAWVLCRAVPEWGALLRELSGPSASVELLLWAGLALLVTGVLIRWVRSRDVSASSR